MIDEICIPVKQAKLSDVLDSPLHKISNFYPGGQSTFLRKVGEIVQDPQGNACANMCRDHKSKEARVAGHSKWEN